ncbi:unnamed protein product [Blepharisma stoltei]|uniref:FCP1 homology domain-containing protein n=1 Tax=Blepharisma stoltei TaxID=1481888 RepID=A0AAU9ILH6_9CILI|nr:unnamed protein product [Blepharisma stoltei]
MRIKILFLKKPNLIKNYNKMEKLDEYNLKMDFPVQEPISLVKSDGSCLITSLNTLEIVQQYSELQAHIPLCEKNHETADIEIEDDSQTMDTETEQEDSSSQRIKPMNIDAIKYLLPMKTRRAQRLTLVLDLDETLVHSEIKPIPAANLIVNIFFDERPCSIYVSFRPGLFSFLEAVAEKFEVVLFTASHKIYAEQVLKFIDPEMKIMKYRFYRESCVETNGTFVKDLKVLGRDLREVIIVDNSVQAFSLQPNNGIPIVSWYNDTTDRELYKTLDILDELHGTADVREVLSQKYKSFNMN